MKWNPKFVWLFGPTGKLLPQIWHTEACSTVGGLKQETLTEYVIPEEDVSKSFDELVAKYPAPKIKESI